MTPKQFEDLKPGQLIRHKLAAQAMTVVGPCREGGYTARRYTRVTNPDEWDVVGAGGEVLLGDSE